MRLPTVLRRILAGGTLAGLAFFGFRLLRDGKLGSVDLWRRNDERFRLYADNASDLVYRYRFHPKPGFEYMSLSSTVMTGYTPEDYYADPDLGLKRVHPGDRHLLEGSMRSSEEPIVLRWYRKDGGLIWTEQRNKPICDVVGNVIAMEGIARDITKRMLAEEARRQNEEQFRLLAEKTSDLVCLHEPDGR